MSYPYSSPHEGGAYRGVTGPPPPMMSQAPHGQGLFRSNYQQPPPPPPPALPYAPNPRQQNPQSYPPPLPNQHYQQQQMPPAHQSHMSPPHHPRMPIPSPSPMASQQHSDPTTNPYAAQRAPVPESISSRGDRSLVAGQQPTPPPPKALIREKDGRRYELMVFQQPQRARMCGFGDKKDRRPITPPPCVKLVITDIATGKEIDVNEIDYALLICTVDIFDEHGNREVNLVNHSSSSPHASPTTLPVSQNAGQYVPVPSNTNGNGNPYSGQPSPQYGHAPPQYSPVYGPGPGSAQQYGPGGPSPYQQPAPYPNGGHQNGYHHPQNSGFGPSGAHPHTPNSDYMNPPPPYPPFARADQERHMPEQKTSPGGMFTRNLIGMSAVAAARLTDCDDRIGIWFVFQDLSVRTEGIFRLHFSVADLSKTSMQPDPEPQQTPTGTIVSLTHLNTGKAKVLAQCFSEPFIVFSAKKFPGVVESTDLSRCFATQGIKIPIRKDGPGKGDRDREDDD